MAIRNSKTGTDFDVPETRLRPGSVKLLTPAEEYALTLNLGEIRKQLLKLLAPLTAEAPEDVRVDHFDQIAAYYSQNRLRIVKKLRTRIDKQLGEYAAVKHRLAVANLPWVTKLARNNKQSTNVSEEDLFQEGVCGLLKGIDRFEPERGLRLMTYATWYIREAMQQIRAKQSHLVAISSHDQTLLGQMEEKVSNFLHEHERLPNRKELDKMSHNAGRSLPLLQAATRPSVSLERGAGEGKIPVPVDDPIPEFDRQEEFQVAVDRLLHTLPDREREIVARRFGLQGFEPTSLDDLGDEFNVSKERIRQLQRQALKRMFEAAQPEDVVLAGA